MRKVSLQLWPHQIVALQSPKRVTCLAGGVGSGKTELGKVFVVNESHRQNKSIGLIASNTYRQLQDATLSRILQGLDEWKIKHKMNWNRMVLKIGSNPDILCRTLTNWDKLAGVELGWYYIDEAWGSPVDGFRELNRRMRCKYSPSLRGLITTNLNGYDWIYEEFVEKPAADKSIAKTRCLIRATTLDNPDLAFEYLENLKATMSKELLMQWVFAQFVNINVRSCYYNFKRYMHVNAEQAKFDPHLPLRFTMDFNYNPLCASVGQQTPNKAWTFKEYVLKCSSTYDLCDAFIRDFASFRGDVYVYGDATGQRHQSSSKYSDYEIIRKKLRPIFGHRMHIRVPNSNPSIRDRLNAVNSMLLNGNEEIRYYVHPDCRKLLMDFETAESPEMNALAIDKRGTDGKPITHPTDAAGYWLHKEFPVIKPTYSSITSAGQNGQIYGVKDLRQELFA
jgi:hypothetical protein